MFSEQTKTKHGADLMRSQQNTKARTLVGYKYTCNIIENEYLHNLQFVFVSHRLTTLLVLRHLGASLEQPDNEEEALMEWSEMHHVTKRILNPRLLGSYDNIELSFFSEMA